MAKKTAKKSTASRKTGARKSSSGSRAKHGGHDGSSLVVVANRLPVRRVKQGNKSSWAVSPGGLVTALHPVLQEEQGAWVGWSGEPGENVQPFQHEGMHLKPVALSKPEVDAYYYGFSNGTLWPLYHDSIRFPQFHRRWWWPYLEVNRRFAEAAAEVVGKNGVVWVQDYQFQLVPAMVRQQRPDAKIGFFLHIPFPSEEMFTRMPWRKQVVEGMLGADVLGFQTKQSARNFAAAARLLTDAKGSDTHLKYEGRTVEVRAFPISIDYDQFEGYALSEKVQAKAKVLKEQLGADRRIMLGVDRLDYTKGIDVRLRAVEELFGHELTSAAEAVFVQIAVPSREDIAAYDDMRRSIEELVGRINGQYAEPGRMAVHYLRRGLPQEDLAAYYLAADVMVVTPFQDGMNLVAKEYVASRIHDDGVMVLSEFAGAAHELKQSIMVNPFDIDGVTSALDQAVRLPEDEAKTRMKKMRRQVKQNDVFVWAERFLDACHKHK